MRQLNFSSIKYQIFSYLIGFNAFIIISLFCIFYFNSLFDIEQVLLKIIIISSILISLSFVFALIITRYIAQNNSTISSYEYENLNKEIDLLKLKIQKQKVELEVEKSKQLISFIDGQEIERQRLSRELHDGLGQLLIAIKMRMESITHVDMSKIRYVLGIVKELFNKTIDEVRHMSNDLMPAELIEFGLVASLRNLCQNIQINSRLIVKFSSSDIPFTIEQKSATYLYRIVQEALNNAVKHAKASRADVILSIENNSIILIIKDNGVGFDVSKAHTGNGSGLYNIQERTKLLNGNVQIESNNRDGTEISISIALNALLKKK